MEPEPTPPTSGSGSGSGFGRAMGRIPELLASVSHQLLLIGLGLWLIGVPLLLPWASWLQPSGRAELIGGNWCNVSSALGACIAAGSGVKILHEHRKRRHLAEATHDLLIRLHERLDSDDERGSVDES